VDNFRGAGADPGTLLGMASEDISGYSLRRGLGSGSAGTVWLLRDLATGRHAVLKRIPKSAVAATNEFLGDLELARTIDHPHIARLLEVRESAGEWLLFSQYVAAGTLTSLLERRGALAPGELVTLISPLAEGLSALHRTGLTHGHLGLGDIMFDADGRPVITDAGLRALAPPTTPQADVTALGAIAHQAGGTPKTFPLSLFTTTPDLLAQQALHRATPAPISLNFTQDPDPTPKPPRPTPATPPSAPTASSAPSTRSASAAPTPSSASSASSARPTPRGPGGGDEVRAAADLVEQVGASSASSASSGSSASSESSAPTASGVRIARSAPPAPAASAAAESPVAAALSLRRSPPSTQRRGGIRQSALRFLRTRRAAYGILAACGAGAVTTLVIGLATVGVLGHPAPSSTAAADQPTKPHHPAVPPAPTPAPTTTRTAAHPSVAIPPRTPAASRPSRPPAVRSTRAADSRKWRETLQALDVRRSRAFATLDPTELNAVYVPGSSPWSADRDLLSSYRKQQLRIEGLRLQIQSVTVETPGRTTVVLRIVDRLIAGAAVSPTGRRTTFPPGKPTTRRVTLTAAARSWRISEIAEA
jgi:protein kinase-like protein